MHFNLYIFKKIRGKNFITIEMFLKSDYQKKKKSDQQSNQEII